MRWACHRLSAFAAVFLVTGDPVAALASTAGSTLPDSVEGIGARGNKRRVARYLNLSHRGISHWYMVYLLPFLALFAIDWGILSLPIFYFFPAFSFSHFSFSHHFPPDFFHFFSWQSLPPMLSFFFMGACLHILGDTLCGTVPGLTPWSRRVGTRLFKVNSLRETLMVVPVSLAAIALRLAWITGI